MKYLRMTIAALTLVSGTVGAQQQCNDQIWHTTPTAGFGNEAPEVVRSPLGLEWLRCPLGFALTDAGTPDEYGDDRCEPVGQAKYTWAEAFAAATALNDGGGINGATGWRLPNVKELMSLVERRCVNPALNLTVFPPVPWQEYWSSTIYWYINDAATVNFSSGFNRRARKEEQAQRQYVRLVRDVPPV